MADDASRINILSGLLKKAAQVKKGRTGVLDEAEEASMGVTAPAPAASAPKGTMTQYEFSGVGKMTDEEKARKAKGLADALRKHNR